MPVFLSCFFLWLVAIISETAVFAPISWFHPNLLLLLSTIFCLHWRGEETHYIAVIYGLTADCFSTLPFGIYGAVFFVMSFISRWYGIKVFQGSTIVLAVYSGIAVFAHSVLILIILSLIFSKGMFSFTWLNSLIFTEALPTMVLAIPLYRLIWVIEDRYKIHLAERKF